MNAEQHTAETILAALRFGVDYTFTIKLRDLEVTVRPLSITERVRVVNEITADMSTKKPEDRNSLTESSLLAIRTIELATTPSHDSKRAPLLPAAVLNQFTNEELLAFYKQYCDGCDRLDPSMDTITPERLNALVDAAKKNALVVTELPRPHLEKVALYLLTRIESPEDSTSGG